MFSPLDSLVNDPWHVWHVIASAFGGATAQRFVVYISKQLPPLPANSGWWKTFIYGVVKGLSGLDPSATIVPPPSGK